MDKKGIAKTWLFIINALLFSAAIYGLLHLFVFVFGAENHRFGYYFTYTLLTHNHLNRFWYFYLIAPGILIAIIYSYFYSVKLIKTKSSGAKLKRSIISESQIIINRYGLILEQTAKMVAAPKSLLFLPEEKIKEAIRVLILAVGNSDPKQIEILRSGYIHLCKFIDDKDAIEADEENLKLLHAGTISNPQDFMHFFKEMNISGNLVDILKLIAENQKVLLEEIDNFIKLNLGKI